MIFAEGEFWKSLNPWEGCSGAVSEGCDNCWLMEQCKRWGNDGREVRATLGWQANLNRQKPTIYAAFGMDFCDPEASPEWRKAFLLAVMYVPRHQVLVCTKRADLLAECLKMVDHRIIPNLWVGVTTENQARFDERVPLLCKAWEGRKFVIAEPLLGPVDLENTQMWLDAGFIDWVLAGRETGPRAREAHHVWFDFLIMQCAVNDVPLWLKSVPDGVEKVRQMPEPLDAIWRAK